MTVASFAPPESLELTQRLFALFKAAAVYARTNAGYRAHAADALACLARMPGGATTIELSEERLLFDGAPARPPFGEWAAGRYLMEEMGRRGVGAVEFQRGADADELDAFVDAFRSGSTAEAVARLLAGAGVSRIKVGAGAEEASPGPGAESGTGGGTGAGREPGAGGGLGAGAAGRAQGARAQARKSFRHALSVLEDLMEDARDGRPPDLSRAETAVHGLVDQVLGDAQSLFALSLLEQFDRYTYAHCVNVCVYSIAIGVRLGLDRDVLGELGFSALFHDFGKTRLPREMIDKPDELTDEEWTQMRRHTSLGALALMSSGRPIDRALGRAVRVAFEHHRGWDGSGYPAAARPKPQDLFARICALGDSFDAMSSGRVYAKRAMSPHETVRRLAQKAGTAYDPFLIGVFVAALGIYPVGTLVLLSDGRVGAVLRNGRDPLRPVLALPGGRALDLSKAENSSVLIRRPLDEAPPGVDARELLDACPD